MESSVSSRTSSDHFRKHADGKLKRWEDNCQLSGSKIGRRIVEQGQKGLNRAEYGTELLYQLSIELSKEFGKEYSVHNLKLFRKFFLVYQKRETVFLQSKIINNFKTKTSSYNNSKKQIGQTVFDQSKIINNFNKEELI